jgi:V/A-type H+-transporting ATPase subunit C
MPSEFVENEEYAYAVARIRALETRLVDRPALSSLLSVPMERFMPQLAETAGLHHEAQDHRALQAQLEAAFTETFLMVKGLILEEELRRLLSLEYDFRLLAHLLKEQRGAEGGPPAVFSDRANVSYQELRSSLGGGRFLSAGEHLYRVYVRFGGSGKAGGGAIDDACARAYYDEVFRILEEHPNEFLREYFSRAADVRNVASVLRLGLRQTRRGDLAGRLLPHGAIDLRYLEDGLGLGAEGLAGLLAFSPLSGALHRVNRGLPPGDQAAEAERLMEQHLVDLLRESRLVIFGIEPLFAYVWLRQNELRNLRTILTGRAAGVEAEEIRKHLRG